VSPTICSEAVCITGVALLSYANAHVENYGLSDHRGWPDSARCSRSRDPNLRSILARSSADDSRRRRSYTSDALPYSAIQICFIISIIKTITTSLLYGKSAISCVIYRTKDKIIISAAYQTVATARIASKICQGQPPTMCSQCSRFHPNRFTFGGIIAERVKTFFAL